MKARRKRSAQRVHAPPDTRLCLQEHNLVPSTIQFISSHQACHACPYDDNLLSAGIFGMQPIPHDR